MRTDGKISRKHLESDLRAYCMLLDGMAVPLKLWLSYYYNWSTPVTENIGHALFICGGAPFQNFSVMTCAVYYFAVAPPQKIKKGQILVKLPAVYHPSQGQGCGGLFQTDLISLKRLSKT